MVSPIEIRRLYQPAEASEGYRVFIDRLWPRGVSKDDFPFDVWCKGLAPSPDLRKWFGHKAKNWAEFCDRYRTELHTPAQQHRIHELLHQAQSKRIILLYGAKDPDHNHAVILARELKQAQHKS